VETDFLMTILKQALPFQSHLKLILMTATMQESLFQEYFTNCPTIWVSGRTFPITYHYLDEIEQILSSQNRLNKKNLKNIHLQSK
jgi:HrpA-like RNA helicase